MDQEPQHLKDYHIIYLTSPLQEQFILVSRAHS